jgi:hypothetical protein
MRVVLQLLFHMCRGSDGLISHPPWCCSALKMLGLGRPLCCGSTAVCGVCISLQNGLCFAPHRAQSVYSNAGDQMLVIHRSKSGAGNIQRLCRDRMHATPLCLAHLWRPSSFIPLTFNWHGMAPLAVLRTLCTAAGPCLPSCSCLDHGWKQAGEVQCRKDATTSSDYYRW